MVTVTRAAAVAALAATASAADAWPPPPGYGAFSAERKADFLWSAITADESGAAFMNPLETLAYAASPAYLRKMETVALDWRERDHRKITHGIGAHARAHIQWEPNSYSGMFSSSSADHCIVRMANAAMPGTVAMTAYGPNLAIKCLNDGAESANLQALWQLDGYAELPHGKTKSCSYFEAPLSSHTPLRDNIASALRDTFVNDFQKVDPHSMLLGVSQMAAVHQNGSRAAAPLGFPFGLVFQPRPELNAIPCVFENYTSQLEQIVSGTTLFDIYAVAEPWLTRPAGAPNVTKLGELRLDSGFVGSTFGDTLLFFRHTFFAEELDRVAAASEPRHAQWLRYTNNTEWMKTEGAMLYAPYLK